MSTNPATKAYGSRVKGLANKLLLGAKTGCGAYTLRGETAQQAILRLIESADPNATRDMQAKAMEIAAARAADMIAFYEAEIVQLRQTLAALQSVPWYRRLRVVSND